MKELSLRHLKIHIAANQAQLHAQQGADLHSVGPPDRDPQIHLAETEENTVYVTSCPLLAKVTGMADSGSKPCDVELKPNSLPRVSHSSIEQPQVDIMAGYNCGNLIC